MSHVTNNKSKQAGIHHSFPPSNICAILYINFVHTRAQNKTSYLCMLTTTVHMRHTYSIITSTYYNILTYVLTRQ